MGSALLCPGLLVLVSLWVLMLSLHAYSVLPVLATLNWEH